MVGGIGKGQARSDAVEIQEMYSFNAGKTIPSVGIIMLEEN
jgi:hypothetical protein